MYSKTTLKNLNNQRCDMIVIRPHIPVIEMLVVMSEITYKFGLFVFNLLLFHE